jgi:hypothetical protein
MDSTKLVVAFRNFAKAPNKSLSAFQSGYGYLIGPEISWFYETKGSSPFPQKPTLDSFLRPHRNFTLCLYDKF